MNELVFKSEKGNPVTTSLFVAEKFQKRHADVLRAIDNLECSTGFRQRNFAFAENQLIGAAKERLCVMNKDGFSFLVMGFTGEKAAKFKEDFIEAFNKMEQVIKNGNFQIPQTFREALLLAAEQQEVIEAQQRLIESQESAVTFTNAVTSSNTNILMRDLAKLICQNGITIGEIRLYDWMVKNKYLIRKSRWSDKKKREVNDYTPTQVAAEMKVFFVDELVISAGEKSFIKHTVKVTGKGQKFFIDKFLKRLAS